MKLCERVEDYLNDRAKAIGAQFANDVIDGLEGPETTSHPIDSPVEQLFWVAWQYRRGESYGELDFKFELFPQCSLGKKTGRYRIDFMVSFFPYVMNSRNPKIVVREEEISKNVEMPLLGIEVDGHIFHEKTKEQVRQDKQRERFLVSKGWKLLRFSGSEVYHDAATCVEEALEVAHELARKYRESIEKYLQNNN